jgi:hypothetical protein
MLGRGANGNLHREPALDETARETAQSAFVASFAVTKLSPHHSQKLR